MTDEAFPWIVAASADLGSNRAAFETQLPRPWTVEHQFDSFVVFDASLRPLGSFHFQHESNRLFPPNYLSRAEARRLATSFANFGNSGHGRAASPNAPSQHNFPLQFAGSKLANSPANLSSPMIGILSLQRITSIAPLVGLILGVIFALFSFDYFANEMARTGIVAACAVWGAVTGVAIGRSTPKA